MILPFLILFVVISYNSENVAPNNQASVEPPREVSDADGNVYRTIRIGNQTWMAENLRTTKYNDSTPIPHITDITAWGHDTSGGYCFYSNTTNQDSISKFGALYNYYAVKSGKMAPSGWRVPTKDDWTILQKFLISDGSNWDGTRTGNKIAKSLASKMDWDTVSGAGLVGCNPSLNNRTGFTAFPSGERIYRGTSRKQGFERLGNSGSWWTTSGYVSSIWFYGLGFDYERLKTMATNSLSSGYSIRLIKDE